MTGPKPPSPTPMALQVPMVAAATVVLRFADGTAEVYEVDGRTASIEVDFPIQGPEEEEEEVSPLSRRFRFTSGARWLGLRIRAGYRLAPRDVPGMPPPQDHGALWRARRLTAAELGDYLATAPGLAAPQASP